LRDVDGDNRSSLHYAAEGGNAAIIQQMLDYGLDASAQDSQGDTPLHQAAVSGSLDAIRLLLENGASAEAQNSSGDTPFSICARNRHLEGMILLKANGANPDAGFCRFGSPPPKMGTPLLYAAYQGNLTMVRLLVEMGADPKSVTLGELVDGAGICGNGGSAWGPKPS
jgi:ankyrin repeat protein